MKAERSELMKDRFYPSCSVCSFYKFLSDYFYCGFAITVILREPLKCTAVCLFSLFGQQEQGDWEGKQSLQDSFSFLLFILRRRPILN